MLAGLIDFSPCLSLPYIYARVLLGAIYRTDSDVNQGIHLAAVSSTQVGPYILAGVMCSCTNTANHD